MTLYVNRCDGQGLVRANDVNYKSMGRAHTEGARLTKGMKCKVAYAVTDSRHATFETTIRRES